MTNRRSFRRQLWSRIAIVTAILFVVLVAISLTLVPLVLGLQGSNVVSDGFFSTGIGGVILGLVGLGMTPRRVSSVVLKNAPSITGGTIGLALFFSGVLLMVAAVLYSLL